MAVPTSPYILAGEVLQAARSMANDAQLSITGDVMASTQPYVFPMLQERYEYMQDYLMAEGVNTHNKYGYITGLVAVASSDPTTQVQVSFTGYNDGVSNHATPTLPADMLEPLEIWERQNGSTNRWAPMKQATDSISTRSQSSRFGIWDYQTDILYLPGATQSIDLKMKYLLYAPKLVDDNSQVLAVRSKSALAALFVAAMARSRGGEEAAAAFDAQAVAAMKLIIQRTVRKESYAQFKRRPFRSHGRRRR